MKLFLDTANLTDIAEALQRGIVSGITTNPSLLSKEEKGDFHEHIGKIFRLIDQYDPSLPLSVEVFTDRPDDMVEQTDALASRFRRGNLVVKIPIGWDELRVIHALRQRDVPVNCTCCMSYNQAIMAAMAGANYVSLFWGRIRDTGYDAATVVRQVRATFREWDHPAEIIVGSIRHIMDINEAFQAGADIVTVPPKFLRPLCQHPKTDEAVRQFVDDFQQWSR